jgi:hypothetical protein
MYIFTHQPNLQTRSMCNRTHNHPLILVAFAILMQLVCLMWDPHHPTILSNEANNWLACISDDVNNRPFNILREMMCLALTMLGDIIDNPKLIQIDSLSCTIDSQAVNIDQTNSSSRVMFFNFGMELCMFDGL